MDESLRSRVDVVHSAARAVISAVPLLGGPLQVLFEEILPRPVDTRREKWLNALTEAVSNLEQEMSDFSPEKLADNEGFVSAVLQASQIAQRTHSEEKINALRNAVENAGRDRGDHTHQIFLHFVDEFTPWHLEALSCLHTPTEHLTRQDKPIPEWAEGDLVMLIEYAFPVLRDERNLPFVIVSELQRRGLVQGREPYETLSREDLLWSSSLTELGLRFFRFITPRKEKMGPDPRVIHLDRDPCWVDPDQLNLIPYEHYETLRDMNFRRTRLSEWLILYNPEATREVYEDRGIGYADKCGCRHCSDFVAIRSRMYPPDFLRMLMGLGAAANCETSFEHSEWFVSSGRYIGMFHFMGAIVDAKTNLVLTDSRTSATPFFEEAEGFKWRFCSPVRPVPGFRPGLTVGIEFEIRVLAQPPRRGDK